MSEIFFCDRLSCVLSVEACSKRFHLVKTTPAYLSCKGCPVSKSNASIVPVTSLSKPK